jgi:hypothetical protein
MDIITILSSFIAAFIGATIPGIFTYIIAKKNRKSNEEIAGTIETNKQALQNIQQNFQFLIHRDSELNKFRLAALDKRMEVAQKAYELWDKLTNVVQEKHSTRNEIVRPAREWWFKNCLYLAPEVRSEFFRILRVIENFDELKLSAKISGGPNSPESEHLNKAWLDILGLSDLIEKSVQLPPIVEVRNEKEIFLQSNSEENDKE